MSEGMGLRLKGLGAGGPKEKVLEDSLMALSCVEIALMRRLPRLNRLDTADETEALDRIESGLRDLA